MPILIILLAFTACYVFQAFQLPAGTLRNVGPGFYPLLIAIIMLLALGLQFIRELRSPSQLKLAVNSFQIIFIVILGSFIFLLQKIGYLKASLIFCFSFSALLGLQMRKKYENESKLKVFFIMPLVAAILITGVDYLLFEMAFDFQLP